jgi:hypothetical protein
LDFASELISIHVLDESLYSRALDVDEIFELILLFSKCHECIKEVPPSMIEKTAVGSRTLMPFFKPFDEYVRRDKALQELL